LSWGETSQVEDNRMELKYSAGTRCGNIDDYWDIDIEELISTIQKMKFIKNSDCFQENTETGGDEAVECPDFVPETIEFGEMTFCSFGTPPDSNEDCIPGPLGLRFHTDTFFDSVSWGFISMYDVDIKSKYLDIFSKKDGKSMSGWLNETLDVFGAELIWTENGEEKKVSAFYTVETKE
jgi:hypothetical protein